MSTLNDDFLARRTTARYLKLRSAVTRMKLRVVLSAGRAMETTNTVLLQIDASATGVLACCFDQIFHIILMSFGCPELNRGE